MSVYRLTTKDNPYSPFTQFDQWLLFDNLNGYGTQQLLDRVLYGADSLSEEENEILMQEAITKIIVNDVLDVYTRKKREDYDIV